MESIWWWVLMWNLEIPNFWRVNLEVCREKSYLFKDFFLIQIEFCLGCILSLCPTNITFENVQVWLRVFEFHGAYIYAYSSPNFLWLCNVYNARHQLNHIVIKQLYILTHSIPLVCLVRLLDKIGLWHHVTNLWPTTPTSFCSSLDYTIVMLCCFLIPFTLLINWVKREMLFDFEV